MGRQEGKTMERRDDEITRRRRDGCGPRNARPKSLSNHRSSSSGARKGNVGGTSETTLGEASKVVAFSGPPRKYSEDHKAHLMDSAAHPVMCWSVAMIASFQ